MSVVLRVILVIGLFLGAAFSLDDEEDYNEYLAHSEPLVILYPPEPETLTVGSYGAPCNETNPCLGLFQCKDGNCDCLENQVFSMADGYQCVFMAGKPRQSSSTPCITGSEPNSVGICTCQPEANYFPGSDGQCQEKKLIGESCTGNHECNFEESYLVCDNGTCSCQPGFTFRQYQTVKTVEMVRLEKYEYDVIVKYNSTIIDTFRKCVGLAGHEHECNLSGECVQFASCQNNSVCICDPGTFQTSKGTCGVGYGAPCSETVDCSDNFVCSDGKCDCLRPNQEIYSPEAEKCLTLTLGTCSADSDCVQNAYCSNVNDGSVTTRRCECKPGYVPNEIGTCDLGFGSKCDLSIPCDRLAGLKCRNQTCACADPSSTYFSPEQRQCLLLAGSRCSRGHESQYRELSCAVHATCTPIINLHHPKLHGVCKCTAGFGQNKDGQCIK